MDDIGTMHPEGRARAFSKLTALASRPWTGGVCSPLSVSLRTPRGGWLYPTKARLRQGARPAMCWRNCGHTQGGRQPGQEVASLVPPRPSGQIWLCRSRPPAVWGAQLACLEEPSTIHIFLTSFLLPPGTNEASPGRSSPQQRTAPPPSSQPCLHPDFYTRSMAECWGEV